MKEIMSPHTPNMRGKVTLEYSNPVTGAVEKRVEVDNYIHPNLKYIWAREQINRLVDNQYLKGQRLTDYTYSIPTSSFFNRILLTDCPDEVDPENEIYLKGKIIGAIDCRNVTTSSSGIAGVLNVNESFVKNGHIHIVGDFGTDRGNGTFQSIGFVSHAGGYNDYQAQGYLAYGPGQRLTNENFYNYPNLSCFCVLGDNCFRTLRNPSEYYIDCLDLGSLTAETLFVKPSIPEIHDANNNCMAVCNNGLFFAGRVASNSSSLSVIYKCDFSGQVTKTLPTSIPAIDGMFFDLDEDVLYVNSSATNASPDGDLNPLGRYWYQDLYKINPETGGLLDTLQMPNGFTNTDRIAGRLRDGTFVRSYREVALWEPGATMIRDFGPDRGLGSIRFAMPDGTLYIYDNYQSYRDYYMAKILPTMMCSRALLPAQQTKTNNYVLKVMYDIYYTDWPDIQIKPDNVFDSSLYFDGTGYVSFGNNESLNITDNFTMEILLKLDPGTPFRGFVKGISSAWDSNAYGLRYLSGRTAFFIAPGVEGQRVEFDVIDNEHVHIAAVVDDEGLKVYVNYLLVDTLPRSGQPIATVTAPLVLGRAYTGSTLMLGKVYQARLWNRALTHYELTEYRNKVIASTAPGLVGNWKFDGGRDDIKDYSGNGNHGTWITV